MEGNRDDVSGLVAARGTRLVNGDNREILLRGVGLGNWLLPEGYMWGFPSPVDRPRRIEKLVVDLVGEQLAQEFWRVYRERYITEDDVALMARSGFNSVRLPINARLITVDEGSSVLNEVELQRIDQFISLCRRHRLYVILDLHGAPGGQTGTHIDDSEHDLPELFTSAHNARLTTEIWRQLALRYRDEWIVAGYDLLNEPLPEWFSEHNDKVLPLYRQIIGAIREVDRDHMIILEGVHWATDWSIFTELPDDNLMLQFHKYWNNPDRESLEPYLSKREEAHVPIFMGEGGENNTDWYSGAFRLFEDLDISWNFWTWKKLDTTNSPVSIPKPPGWEDVVGFASGGHLVNRAEAQRTLWSFLDNLETPKCDHHPQVVRSLFRRPPVRIPSVFYSNQDRGIGFDSEHLADTGVQFRVGDHMSIIHEHTDSLVPNFKHLAGEHWDDDDWLCLKLEAGSWAAYDFQVTRIEDVIITLQPAAGAWDSTSTGVTITMDQPCGEAAVSWDSRGPTGSRRVRMAAASGNRRVIVRVEHGVLALRSIAIDFPD